MKFDLNENKPVVVLLGAAAFLLSDEASFITGTDLLIDGGVIASITAGTYALGR